MLVSDKAPLWWRLARTHKLKQFIMCSFELLALYDHLDKIIRLFNMFLRCNVSFMNIIIMGIKNSTVTKYIQC